MVDELSNIITAGTQLMQADKDTERSTRNIPINEDWSMLCKIISYVAPKVKVVKVWDKANNPTVLNCWAMYPGIQGEPTNAEVVVGNHCHVYRTGVGNVDFVGTPTGFQLDDEQSTTKASFAAFFFPAYPSFGPPAFIGGVRSDILVSGVVESYRKIAPGLKWFESSLKRLISWDISNLPGNPWKIRSMDPKKVLIAENDILSIVSNSVVDCFLDDNSKVYQENLICGRAGGTPVWIVVPQGPDLAATFDCC